MADIKISQLGEASVVADADVFPMTASGVTVKTPASILKEYAVGDTDISAIGDGTATGAVSAVNLLLQRVLGNFAEVESTTTAAHAYSVGDYLILDGLLYRVTSAITIGDTIDTGTNVVQTTVEDEYRNLIVWKQSQAIASTSGSSGTFCTITDSAITADHVLDKFVAADRSVITSDISCTCSTGQAVITGVSTAATSAEIKLVKATKIL